jgi:hypothetical protein
VGKTGKTKGIASDHSLQAAPEGAGREQMSSQVGPPEIAKTSGDLRSDQAGQRGVDDQRIGNTQPTRPRGLVSCAIALQGNRTLCGARVKQLDQRVHGCGLPWDDFAGVFSCGAAPPQNSKFHSSLCFCGGPDRTRTCDLRFRKPLLYPAELRDRVCRNVYFKILRFERA